VLPASGVIPSRTKRIEKRAWSEAMRRSMFSVIVSPTPIAGPLIAAMSGFALRKKAESSSVARASSGCRMAILFALRHPQSARGLLLWRATGGRVAAEHLARQYYTDYIELAQRGGMAAVCESEHFRERIAARPENRARLTAMGPQRFIAVMSHWREYFIAGADQPVIGASDDELRSIRVPTCIASGNDHIHPRRASETLSRLIPRAEVRDIMPPGPDLDEIPFAEWDRREGELAAVFLDFLKRADALG